MSDTLTYSLPQFTRPYLSRCIIMHRTFGIGVMITNYRQLTVGVRVLNEKRTYDRGDNVFMAEEVAERWVEHIVDQLGQKGVIK